MISALRIHEKILLAFFAYLTAAALIFPLDLRLRLVVIPLNLLVAAVLVLLSREGAEERSRFLTQVRDWIPCVLILVAYRESGLFFTPDPTHRLDDFFIRFDDALLKHPGVLRLLDGGAPWLQRYLEFSYFLCYPIVPLGLASLYLVRNKATDVAPGFSPADARPLTGASHHERHRTAVEYFWTTVLLASFTCYLLFPLFPLTPPRELFNDVPGPHVAPFLRGMNRWLLGRYAVGASLFPSAHVAATTAMALAIRRYLPRFGLIFVLIAASIALATIYGRYHYAADALAGAVIGLTAHLVSKRLFGAFAPVSLSPVQAQRS
jgi:membrane-associated phospholipid phosphatase